MLTVGSLFSGIGGMELGLEWTGGFETKWQVEIDDYARRVLAKHWPNVKRYEDVREVGAHNLEPVDLICGGFPCPPVSLAGKQLGSDDERWLWPDFARIIRLFRPRLVVAENVPGLLSTDDGRCFGAVLRDLAECGYDAEWESLSASAFGAPHPRWRVYLVAYPNNARPQPSLAQESRPTMSGPSRCDPDFRNPNGGRLPSGLFGRCRPRPEKPPTGHCTSLGTYVGETWAPECREDWLDDGLPLWLAEVYSRLWGNAVVPQVVQWIGERILEHARP